MGTYNLSDFGYVDGDQATVVTAWNAAMAQLKIPDVLILPAGGLQFISQPATIKCSVIGQGRSSGTTLYKQYHTTDPMQGFLCIDPTSGHSGELRNFNINANPPYAGGIAIKVSSTNGLVVDAWALKDISVFNYAGQMWNYGLYMDGSLRTSPRGHRLWRIDNLNLFACSDAVAYLKSVVNLTATAFNCFPAGGTSNKLVITGLPGVEAASIYIQSIYVDQIDVSYAREIRLQTSAGAGAANNGVTKVSRGAGITNVWTY